MLTIKPFSDRNSPHNEKPVVELINDLKKSHIDWGKSKDSKFVSSFKADYANGATFLSSQPHHQTKSQAYLHSAKEISKMKKELLSTNIKIGNSAEQSPQRVSQD